MGSDLNFITQLLPGLRDVRGPLIAGYLWLFAGWLLLADHLPHRETAAVYRHAFEVGEALGPVGLAAAVSVTAYLTGSLQQAIMGSIDAAYKSLKRRVVRLSRRLAFPSSGDSLGFVPAWSLLYGEPVLSLNDFRWVDGDGRTKEALEDLVYTRLEDCMDDLSTALDEAVDQIVTGAKRHAHLRDDLDSAALEINATGNMDHGWAVKAWRAAVGEHRREGEAGAESVPVPSFSATREIFDELPAIKTQLIETAPHAGTEVERVYAESDFRFVIALPLAAVAVVLTVESRELWWLGLLGAVVGLIGHSIVLRKHAGREMVEALRSRPNPQKLDQITPVFRQYEEEVTRFCEGLGAERWEILGASVESPEGSRSAPLLH